MLTTSKILKTGRQRSSFDHVFLFLCFFLIFSHFFKPVSLFFDPISSLKWLKSGSCSIEDPEDLTDCSFAKPLIINNGKNLEGWFYAKKKIDLGDKHSKILVLDKNTNTVIGVGSYSSPHFVYVESLVNKDVSIGVHSETLGRTAVAKGDNKEVFLTQIDFLESDSEWFTIGDNQGLPWDWSVGLSQENILKISNFNSYVVLVWKK